jgi:hypothetical protein
VRIAAVAPFLWALGVNATRPVTSDTKFWSDARKRLKEPAPEHTVADGRWLYP